MTLTPNELLAMVTSVQPDVELDEVDMQCDLDEANWEELESDDGHRELYID